MDIKRIYQIFKQYPVVCTDSRKITKGCIYVALKGGNFDGNAFAGASLNAGAAYAIVDDPTIVKDGRYILVEDGLQALQQLAREHRDQFTIPVIGVTGSNGKTTTKELMHAVLSQRYNVLATKGNLNNHIGVPLTLLELKDEHDLAIIEMGASKQGDIEELCQIADPDFGLITNIGKAHMETMGGIEGVLKTKTELYRYVTRKGGMLFVHSCDLGLTEAAHGTRQMRYGALPADDVSGCIVRDGHLVSVQWRTVQEADWDARPVVRTRLTGTYNLPNIMASVALGIHFGLSEEEIAAGISGYEPTNSRSEVRQAGSNLLILDAYNANPSSMEVAINNLLAMDGERRSVILGEMLEVGPTSADEHLAVCERLAGLGLTTVCLVGKEFFSFRERFRGFHFFDNVDALLHWLSTHELKDEVVLIKGSRGNRLEKAGEHLMNSAA
jgi:UDP-N-acetylmuramoyl-tripeptide--D-alanyl-D-alanine ligase